VPSGPAGGSGRGTAIGEAFKRFSITEVGGSSEIPTRRPSNISTFAIVFQFFGWDGGVTEEKSNSCKTFFLFLKNILCIEMYNILCKQIQNKIFQLM
jgi:hypothetical protein